jgi:hypothetical protein
MGKPKGPRKDRERSDIQILTEWAAWMAARPHSEADTELIRCVMNVCSQVGTWKAKHDRLEERVRKAEGLLEEVTDWLCPHTEAVAQWKELKGARREWCCQCSNYLRNDMDASLPERTRAYFERWDESLTDSAHSSRKGI